MARASASGTPGNTPAAGIPATRSRRATR
jgi:hypothetical protein